MYNEESIYLDLTKNASQMNADELNGYGALAYAVAKYNFDEMLLKDGHLSEANYKESLKALGTDKIKDAICNMIVDCNILEACCMKPDASPQASFIYRRERCEKLILIDMYNQALKGLGQSF